MAYDKKSFLSGVAAGRNMESWPAFEEGSAGTFSFTVLADESTSMTFCFSLLRLEGLVDWGDGTVDSIQKGNEQPLHTYNSSGIYRIQIAGKLWCIRLSPPASYPDSPKMVLYVHTPLPPFPEEIYHPSIAHMPEISGMFRGCSNLLYVPNNPFRNYKLPGLTVSMSTSGLFWGCSALEKVPENLFVGLNLREDCNFSWLFRDCVEISELPSNLFDNDTISTQYVHGMFDGCTNLKRIPSGLFDHFDSSKPLYLYETFRRSGIEEVPDGLFDNCSLGNCYCAFYECTSLRHIPDGLFKNQANATTFEQTFYDCSSLEEIPDELFYGCSAAETFNECFYSCDACYSIGSGVFSGCTSALNMRMCFAFCRNISSIPSGIFSDLTAAQNFSGCFYQLKSITSVPSGLFSRCTSATTFASCFYECNELLSVASDAFSGLSSVTNFKSTFYRCAKIESSVPALWTDYPNASGTGCFTGCSNALNWSQIPSTWGGPLQI